MYCHDYDDYDDNGPECTKVDAVIHGMHVTAFIDVDSESIPHDLGVYTYDVDGDITFCEYENPQKNIQWISKYLHDAEDLALNNQFYGYKTPTNDAPPDVDPQTFNVSSDRRVVAFRNFEFEGLFLDFWVELNSKTNALIEYHIYAGTGDPSVYPSYNWDFVRQEFPQCDELIATCVREYLADGVVTNKMMEWAEIEEYGVNSKSLI